MDESEHIDYQAPRPSERHRAAIEALALLRQEGLSQDLSPTRGPSGRCYAVRFARPGQCQGELAVFSTSYVRVSYATAGLPGLGPFGNRCYSSVEEALAFVLLAFGEGNVALACQIAEKIPGRKRNRISR